MTRVFEFYNPFEPKKDFRSWEERDGLSIRAILKNRFGDSFVDFELPTFCMVNGEPILRDDWDKALPDDATVSFVRLAGDLVTAIIAIVVLVVAVVVSVSLASSKPAAVSSVSGIVADIPEGDPVYNLSGQRNQQRLNEPIEVSYGRVRLWPSYAAKPYTVYESNQQYQFSLFCLGQGSFAVEKVQFEDTDIVEFDDVEFELIAPGSAFTLFSDNVHTSSAVAGVELFGPNEPEFTGWTGNYPANPAFSQTKRIELDITLPQGLYYANDAGGLNALGVSVAVEYRAIDDFGTALSAWQSLPLTKRTVYQTAAWNDPLPPGATVIDDSSVAPTFSLGGNIYGPRTYAVSETYHVFSKVLATVTAQRYTLRADVPLGRYEIRMQRLSAKNTSHRAGNAVRWDALRAFFPSVQSYGNVTLLAVKARATNSLNNNAAQRLNAIATRKIPCRENGVWTAPQATRSPVWAFCDVFRASYGGRLPDEFLDLAYLEELAEDLESRLVNFDWTFDQRTTVWEAARAIGRVARCVPILDGSRITLTQETSQDTIAALFNEHNIVAGSLSWGIKLSGIQQEDGLEIEYVDPETWKPETVLCLLENDEGSAPRLVKLPGCADRARAYREGLFMRAGDLYLRESIDFKTGLEGHLPRYGDLILVSHDVPRWGTGGLVLSHEGSSLRLDRPVTFAEGQEHRIVLRKKDGSAYGPVPCLPGAENDVVLLPAPIPEDQFYFDSRHELPGYLFGIANNEARRCRVVDIRPESEDIVQVKCVGYDSRIFAYDDAVPPPLGSTASAVTVADRPVVKELLVSATTGSPLKLQLSWEAAQGASSYQLEQSGDGVSWLPLATVNQNSFSHDSAGGLVYLRVAGVGRLRGPWAAWSGRVGPPLDGIPDPATNLSVAKVAQGLSWSWDSVAAADSYELRFTEPVTFRLLRKVFVPNSSFLYTRFFAAQDSLIGSSALLIIRARNVYGFSTEASLLGTFSPPEDVSKSNRADSTTFTAASVSVLASST